MKFQDRGMYGVKATCGIHVNRHDEQTTNTKQAKSSMPHQLWGIIKSLPIKLLFFKYVTSEHTYA